VACAGLGPFEFNVEGRGCFPDFHRPRVIWVGVQAPPDLAAVQRGIDLETARLGYAGEERDFSPHLTLGRITRSVSPEEARQIGTTLGSMKVSDLGLSRIQAVHFYRSDLNPQGAVYTKLYSAPFHV